MASKPNVTKFLLDNFQRYLTSKGLLLSRKSNLDRRKPQKKPEQPSKRLTGGFKSKSNAGAGKDGAHSSTPIVPLKEAKRFVVDCLTAAGASTEFACTHADALVEADNRGLFTYGLNQLELNCKYLKKGQIQGKDKPVVLKETESCVYVDGKNALGSIVGNFCIQTAIKKAEKCGVSLVVAKNSNPYGTSAVYTEQAVKCNLIGICCTTESPRIVVPRSKEAVFGINHIAFAAPISDKDYLSLDITTAATSLQKIRAKSNENQPLPVGWVVNQCGEPETNADMALKFGMLVPLGSLETHGVFKGFGLTMMIDVLAGILPGANYGPTIPDWNNLKDNETMNLGHCFIVINPEVFAPGFQDRLECLVWFIRQMEPIDTKKPVWIPGDHERDQIKETVRAGGIRYEKRILAQCEAIAKDYNVKPLLPIK